VRELLINVLIILLSILLSPLFTKRKNEWFWNGLLYAVTTCLCTAFPFPVYSGVYYDLRIIPLLLAILYGGVRTGLVATSVFVLYRLYLGGTGLVYTLLSYGMILALAFSQSRQFHSYSRRMKFVVATALDLGLVVSGILYVWILKQRYTLHAYDPLEFLVSYALLNLLGIWVSVYLIELLRERHQVRLRIDHMAFHDYLTGLPNRLLFLKELEKAIQQAERKHQNLAVLFLDLDRFKYVNDTFGHHVGDELIQEFAKRVSSCIRESDLLARIGGDEFTLFLRDFKTEEDVRHVAERIIRALKTPIHLEGHNIHVSTSIGIALFPQDGRDAKTLMQHADAAMYQAKEKGKNNYQWYKAGQTKQESHRILLENGLRLALEHGQLYLLFQPKVDLYSGEIIGAEAMIRWQHPQLGIVKPSEFIPLAEETGFIYEIDEWVLATACMQMKKWQDQALPPVPISINLSAYQFRREDLPEIIHSVLQETGLSPQWLELEITERSFIRQTEEDSLQLKRLKDMGIHLSLDDFGTGFSSLRSLKHFTVDTLKIDPSFIQDLASDSKDAAIAKAIIALGHSLQLKVIAVGVETLPQLAFLQEQKCDALQGYLFSKPVPAQEFEQLLREKRSWRDVIQRIPSGI
jgi:diguanylate cyclase (GGDEF)-like protein